MKNVEMFQKINRTDDIIVYNEGNNEEEKYSLCLRENKVCVFQRDYSSFDEVEKTFDNICKEL